MIIYVADTKFLSATGILLDCMDSSSDESSSSPSLESSTAWAKDDNHIVLGNMDMLTALSICRSGEGICMSSSSSNNAWDRSVNDWWKDVDDPLIHCRCYRSKHYYCCSFLGSSWRCSCRLVNEPVRLPTFEERYDVFISVTIVRNGIVIDCIGSIGCIGTERALESAVVAIGNAA